MNQLADCNLFIIVDSLRLGCCQSFTKNAGWAEDEDQNEHRKGNDILELIRCCDSQAIQEKDWANGFEDAKEKAAEHGSWEVTNAAQHRCSKRLDTGNEPHICIDLSEHQSIQYAASTGCRRAQHKGPNNDGIH